MLEIYERGFIIRLLSFILTASLFLVLIGCGGRSAGTDTGVAGAGGQKTEPNDSQIDDGVWSGNIHQQGNDANGGWVVQGQDGNTYIGTEYGLFSLNPDDEFYQYTSWPAGAMNLYGQGEYIIYGEYPDGYSNGARLCAFDLTPLSEPYPTEMLYWGSASNTQIDWLFGRLYFIGDGVLSRMDLTPLLSSLDNGETPEFQLEGISLDPVGWLPMEDPGDDPDYGPVSPAPPPEAPLELTVSADGIYASVGKAGARYEEFVYLYSHDGKNIQAIDALTDIACRGMFWFDLIQGLFFSYDADRYESQANDVREAGSGIYAYIPGNGQIARFSDDGKSDFNLWYDVQNVTTGSGNSPRPIYLITAGGVNQGSIPGVFKINVGGESPGEPVRLYNGLAASPNIARGYVYFRAPSKTKSTVFDYYRVPADGSSGAERLDFKNETINPV
jgi:hypothetical protein